MPKLPQLRPWSVKALLLIGLPASIVFISLGVYVATLPMNSQPLSPIVVSLDQPTLRYGKIKSPVEESVAVNNDTNQTSTTTSKKGSKNTGQVAGTTSPGAVTPAPAGSLIGIYDTSSPSDPVSHQRLKDIAAGGFNIVHNYTPWDGSIAQIRAYLDTAQSVGIRIVFSLKDFYDKESYVPLSEVSQHGSTYDQVALNLVQQLKNHPAIYGWSISDERPETPASLASWLPVLQQRAQAIRQIDPNHPTLGVMQCYPGTYLNDTGSLNQLGTAMTDLGLDTYPIPYNDINLVGQCASTLAKSNITGRRWFVVQSFSWKSYPDIPNGLGYNLSQARYPTKAELQTMVNQARSNGANNIMFYSYFDMKKDTANFATNWANLTEVVKQMKQP